MPMMLLDADSVQRAVADSQVTDAFALHKPGIRDARTLHGARVWGRTPESRRQHKRELEQETADRDAAFAERGQYLRDAWKTPAHYRQPFGDSSHTMQQGYHPMIALEYQHRDLRGPRQEKGGPDSDFERAAMKERVSNAWRTYDPHHPPALASSSMHERFDPAPGGGAYNESKIAAARSRKEEKVSVSREDYIRRTRTAWDPTAATGIEAQREKWLG